MTPQIDSPSGYARIAPEVEIERALRELRTHSGCEAAALCLREPTSETLRLAAEIGLDNEGCRALRALRPDGGSWQAPLEAVRDRRVLVLESLPGAGPRLIPGNDGHTIACLPIGAPE